MQKKSQDLFIRDPQWMGQLFPVEEPVVEEEPQVQGGTLLIDRASEMEVQGVEGQDALAVEEEPLTRVPKPAQTTEPSPQKEEAEVRVVVNLDQGEGHTVGPTEISSRPVGAVVPMAPVLAGLLSSLTPPGVAGSPSSSLPKKRAGADTLLGQRT